MPSAQPVAESAADRTGEAATSATTRRSCRAFDFTIMCLRPRLIRTRHGEPGAREMHDHFAGDRIAAADRDVLRRRGYDLAGHRETPVIVGRDTDTIAGLETIRIGGIGVLDGRRLRASADRERLSRRH